MSGHFKLDKIKTMTITAEEFSTAILEAYNRGLKAARGPKVVDWAGLLPTLKGKFDVDELAYVVSHDHPGDEGPKLNGRKGKVTRVEGRLVEVKVDTLETKFWFPEDKLANQAQGIMKGDISVGEEAVSGP